MSAQSTHAPRPPETPLLALIEKRIREEGPLSIAAFMDLALNHPDHGYYHSKEPFGVAGDFITAPEVSQVFGELIGLWLATAWQQAGQPTPFRLIELGPGRGQLMADLVRATEKVPGFLKSADIHLVESSRRLQDVQRAQLPDLAVTWHDRLETVPKGPLFLIANEFFDALPVHQLVRTEAGLAERVVSWEDDVGLTFAEADPPPALLDLIESASPGRAGEIAEVSPARRDLARQIGERISREGGVGAIIDYGAWADQATGDTLQAVRDHRHVDPLSAPGEVDLTAQVDFKSLGQAAALGGADVFGPVPQGTFLHALGIEVRTATLLRSTNESQGHALRQALFRLTDASAMGELFKVLALSAPGAPLPPGFQAPTLQGHR